MAISVEGRLIIDVHVRGRRLRGGGPKKRCNCFISVTERCSQAAIRIVGDCSFCEKAFCGRHRLPEGAFSLPSYCFLITSSLHTDNDCPRADHQCPNLQNCKNEAFLKNKNKLESEQTVGRKIESM